MAGKESGLGNALYVGGYDMSGETKSWALSGGPALIDTTGLRSLAFERLGGQLSGMAKYVTHFDPLAAVHTHFSTLPRGDEIGMLAHRETLGAPAANWVARQLNYDPTRDANGAVTFSLDSTSDNSGIDWGVLGTAGKRVDTTATNGAGIDHGIIPPGSFGLQAYLQVFAFTGTSITVKLQGSSDDGAGDAYADIVGGGFVAATAIGAQKIETSRTLAVERYFRVVTTGTFSSCTFAVAVVINDQAEVVLCSAKILTRISTSSSRPGRRIGRRGGLTPPGITGRS